MAHDLSIRADGRAEMAFAGETPWHGLGQRVTKGAAVEIWAREAGMDWCAMEGTPSLGDTGSPGQVVFSDYKGLYRSDTGKPLAIVGANYKVVQPREVLEFFREMTETGGWHIHTAGVLRGGRKLWAMATRGDYASVGGRGKARDEVAHNLLLATSLDGSMQTTVADTAVRVVCANTLALALRENDRVIRISHRSVFDADAVRRALGVAEESFDAFMVSARQLAAAPCGDGEAKKLLDRIFGIDKAKKPDTSWLGSLKTLGEQQDDPAPGIAKILALFEGGGRGSNLATAKGTRWGLLNAVTEHVDWSMGRTDDTRIDSAWFGRGNATKQEALAVLTA